MNEAAPQNLLRLGIILPFALVALIWGSTWYVITGQISDVPPSWSVTWRFALATPAMFAVALAMGRSLKIGWAGQMLAILIGLSQFCLNFNFVYRAEMHLTSGIVAVMFGLLIVPNMLFGRIILKQQVSLNFLIGSGIAIAGIVMLLLHEARLSPLGGNVGLGVLLAIGGILAASFANVIQANKVGKELPMASLLAWAMLYGTIFDFVLAWAVYGPPVFPDRWQYWAGTAYLGWAGSVVTFPLYYNLVRQIGAGRAAYNSVAVIIVAMLISTFAENYQWSLLSAGGGVLAMVGMVLALRGRKA